MLKNAFDLPIVKKFATISQLASLKLDENIDPYEYYSKYTKLAESVRLLEISNESFLQYYFWEGLNEEFKSIFIQLTNKTKPDLSLLTTKFFEVCERYNSVADRPVFKDSTALAVKVNCNEKRDDKNKFRRCVLCSETMSDHQIFKCEKYSTPELKLARIKELGGCFKCGGIEHLTENCKFKFYKKCFQCKGWHFTFLCPEGTKFIEKKKLEVKFRKDKNSSKNDNLKFKNSANVINLSNNQSKNVKSNSAIPTFTFKVKNFKLRGMKDLGSQSNFITKKIVDKFNLKILQSFLETIFP